MVSNNCGAMETGLAVLLAAERIARVTGSYIGEQEFARQGAVVWLLPSTGYAASVGLATHGCGLRRRSGYRGVGRPLVAVGSLRSARFGHHASACSDRLPGSTRRNLGTRRPLPL